MAGAERGEFVMPQSRRSASSPKQGKRKPSQASTRAKSAKAVKVRASKTAAAARRAGARGNTRKSARLRVLRDSAIIARIEAGATKKEAAAEFEVTVRTVERVLEDFRTSPSPLDKRPMDIVESIARTYRRLIADFEAMSFAHAESNPNVSLGAKKAAADALERYVMMLADIGKLPDNLELFRSESEMLRIGELMLEKMQLLEQGELSPVEVADFFRGLMTSHAPLGTWDAPAGSVRELPPGEEDEDGDAA